MCTGDVSFTALTVCQLIVYIAYVLEILLLAYASFRNSDSVLNLGAIAFVICWYCPRLIKLLACTVW